MKTTGSDGLPQRADYGRGCYRRCIELLARGASVRGRLQDDFHDFGVDIEHDGRELRRIRGRDIRVPWTTCPAAVPALESLRGCALDRAPGRIARATDVRSQCTHLFDLALLAIAHAARQVDAAPGGRRRRYRIEVPDRSGRRTRAALDRDGRPLLRWWVEGSRILEAAPERFAGRSLAGADFTRFVEHELDADEAEAAWVLRRAVFIGLGRRWDFERITRAERFAPVVGSACHTFSSPVVQDARRVPHSVRDWSDDASGLFASLEEPWPEPEPSGA